MVGSIAAMLATSKGDLLCSLYGDRCCNARLTRWLLFYQMMQNSFFYLKYMYSKCVKASLNSSRSNQFPKSNPIRQVVAYTRGLVLCRRQGAPAFFLRFFVRRHAACFLYFPGDFPKINRLLRFAFPPKQLKNRPIFIFIVIFCVCGVFVA